MQQSQKKRKGLPPIQLTQKISMPSIGMGTFGLNNQQQFCQLLKKSFRIGYQLLDTARFYNNQDIIGRSLVTCFKQQRIKRQDLFIVTKTWNDSSLNFVKQLKKSLKSLQLSYVDLYLLHWPICALSDTGQFQHKQMQCAWKQMQECVRKGYAKNIGLSNFNLQSIMEILTFCKIKPAVNQIQCHAYNINISLIQSCQKFGIQIMAYCPLARGIDTSLDSNLLKQDFVQEIAYRHNKTSAQVVLRLLGAKNICVIPKTSSLQRLQQNFDYYTFELSEDDCKKLKNLNKGLRVVNPKSRPMYSFMPVFD